MKKIHFLPLALVSLAISCATLQKKSDSVSFTLETTSWQLCELNGKGMQPTEERYTLNFNVENALNARGECNIIFGDYEQLKGDNVKLSPVGSTRTACPNMDVEAEFTEALARVATFEVVDEILHLIDEKGDVVMRLQRR